MATPEKSLPGFLKITLSIKQRSLNLAAADGPKVLKEDEQNPHTKDTYQQKKYNRTRHLNWHSNFSW
jgi:hypothetical protein